MGLGLGLLRIDPAEVLIKGPGSKSCYDCKAKVFFMWIEYCLCFLEKFNLVSDWKENRVKKNFDIFWREEKCLKYVSCMMK